MKCKRSGQKLTMLNKIRKASFFPDCLTISYPRWTELSPLNKGRAALGLEWIPDGRLFAVGGADYPNSRLATVEMLECPWSTAKSVNSKWQYVAPMQQARQELALAYFKGKIIAAGGDESDSVECFTLPTSELRQGQWVNIRPMSHAKSLIGIFPFGGDLLFVGKHVIICFLVFFCRSLLCAQGRLRGREACAAVTRARHHRNASLSVDGDQWEDTRLSVHFSGMCVCTR